MSDFYFNPEPDELYHHGVKGMKWGVRRYQNPDGSVTAAGKKRYGDKTPYEYKTTDGDTFRINGGATVNMYRNNKNVKVTKTRGKYLYEVDQKKLHNKASKQYKKQSGKVMRDLQRQQNSMWVKSYNKAADYMNGEGIDKFNKQQEKKYGKDFGKRDGYMDDYQKLFDKKMNQNLNKALNDFYSNNKNVQKSRDLVKKYEMTKWDDLAKQNESKIEEVRKVVNSYH